MYYIDSLQATQLQAPVKMRRATHVIEFEMARVNGLRLTFQGTSGPLNILFAFYEYDNIDGVHRLDTFDRSDRPNQDEEYDNEVQTNHKDRYRNHVGFLSLTKRRDEPTQHCHAM